MVNKQKFNVHISQKVMILFIAAVIIIALSVTFAQIGAIDSETTRIQYIVFAVIIIIAIIVLYNTMKSVSFRMAVKFRN